MQLYIGNKNYSSWSMRPWVLLTNAGIAFDEVVCALTLLRLAPPSEPPSTKSTPWAKCPAW